MKRETLSRDWVLGDVVVRHRPVSQMVALTDLWKAAGSPTPLRPDKWFKSGLIQERLEQMAVIVGSEIDRDKKGKVVGVPGVIEVVRGGRYTQGTFISYDLAIEYTELLSPEMHKWFTSVLPGSSPEHGAEDSGSIVLGISLGSEDFGGQVRITPDGRVSVYDGIGYVTGHKNPRQVWNDLADRISVFVQKTDKYKFPGRGGAARPTPVATLEVFLEILVTLPGQMAAMIREKAVRTLVRAMQGDLTLVEEILDRIHGSEELFDLEMSIRSRREKAYGNELPSGLLSNPLTELTSQVKNGYGWSNKTEEMTDLLAQLATHVGGMIVERETPHRPHGGHTSKARSRIIPLTLRALRNIEVLHVYQFESTYIDDADVAEVFIGRAYPEVAYRDYREQGVKQVVVHLVSPGGITQPGVEKLSECQATLDRKYRGTIRLDAMRLDELVWGEMYPAIQERYQDSAGKFGSHHLNRKVKQICKRLCTGLSSSPKMLQSAKTEGTQLSLFSELLSGS